MCVFLSVLGDGQNPFIDNQKERKQTQLWEKHRTLKTDRHSQTTI